MSDKHGKNSEYYTAIAGCIGVGILCPFPMNAVMIGAGAVGLGMEAINVLSKDSESNRFFKNLGMYNKEEHVPLKISKRKTDFGYEMRYTIPLGMSIKDFEKNQEELEVYFKHPIKLCYDNDKNAVVQVYEVELEKEYNYYDMEEKLKQYQTKKLQIPLGISFGGKIVVLDLKETVHLLIAGETDSGKTTAIRYIITWLIAFEDVDMYLIDLKGTEFQFFTDCSCVKDYVLGANPERALEILSHIEDEVKRRNDIFQQNNVKDFYAYNTKFKKSVYDNLKLPH